jgi:hypothetical protein
MAFKVQSKTNHQQMPLHRFGFASSQMIDLAAAVPFKRITQGFCTTRHVHVVS